MAIRKRGKAWQIDYIDPTGKRVRKSYKKKKDAVAELGKRVSLIAEGRYLDVKKEFKTTLKELIEKYEENYGHQSSFKSAKRFFITRYEEYFGEDRQLSNIKYVDLETFRNYLRETLTHHKKVRTVAAINREMSCLRHMFRKSVEWDMASETPFSKGKSLILKENNSRLRFLSDTEITKLLGKCPVHIKPVVICAIHTGMRKGEILSLKWSQVRGGFIYLERTKTNEPRQVPINGTLEKLLKRLKKGSRSEYVFLYHGARIIDVKSWFEKAVADAGLVDFRFHDLRHTFASQMVMRGASLKDVQEILGHKTMTMTLRYSHLTQEHKKKAVDLLNSLTAKNFACHKMSQNPTKEKTAKLAVL